MTWIAWRNHSAVHKSPIMKEERYGPFSKPGLHFCLVERWLRKCIVTLYCDIKYLGVLPKEFSYFLSSLLWIIANNDNVAVIIEGLGDSLYWQIATDLFSVDTRSHFIHVEISPASKSSSCCR